MTKRENGFYKGKVLPAHSLQRVGLRKPKSGLNVRPKLLVPAKVHQVLQAYRMAGNFAGSAGDWSDPPDYTGVTFGGLTVPQTTQDVLDVRAADTQGTHPGDWSADIAKDPQLCDSSYPGRKKSEARKNWRTKIDQHNKDARKKGLHVYWCYGHGENMVCRNCHQNFDFSGAVAHNNVAGRAAKYMKRPCKALVILDKLASASNA